ncbi:MAG TPA: hypothetical protein VM431_07285 [Phycisphaerae bacterium]|nr:hypothetical protein [Phycisphaerae bacterium]
MPHGIVLYVQVEDEIEGPDGRYLLLRAVNTRSSALVRVDDLLGRDGRGPLTGRTLPQRGTWFALAGAVVSRFDTGERRGIYVLPFEWTPYVPDPEDPRDDRNRPPRGGPPPPPPGGRRG